MLLAIPLLALPMGSGCEQRDDATDRAALNLLLVTIDTLRADHLGCYGYPQPTSPVLDDLAASALLFENAVAQSAVTPVSHASILTGLNPYRHGLRSLHGGTGYRLAADRLTLAELMRANGRATGGFVGAFTATQHFGLHRGFDRWDEDFEDHRGEGRVSAKGIVNTGRSQRRANETTDRALGWLRGHSDRPFFAWVHYFDVHDPLLGPPETHLSRFPARSESDADRLIAIYDAEIAFVDEQLGRILRFLDETGIRDRTAVAVLADHGQGLGDHDWWGHGILYQEQVRVPFVLSIPGVSEGKRVSALARTIDLVPTLVDWMGLECPGGSCDFDGRSLRAAIEGGTPAASVGYSESLNDLSGYSNVPFQNDSFYAVNDGRWKLIARYRGRQSMPSMLFDLENDPRETTNVIERHREIEQRLRAQLEATGAIVEMAPLTPLDPGTRERLEALGYVR